MARFATSPVYADCCHLTVLPADEGPPEVCEGAFDALALLAAGVPRVVAIYGVQGWRWDWVRFRELVFALDADTAGQQPWRQRARQAVLRGKPVAAVPETAYGGGLPEGWQWGLRVVRARTRPRLGMISFPYMRSKADMRSEAAVC